MKLVKSISIAGGFLGTLLAGVVLGHHMPTELFEFDPDWRRSAILGFLGFAFLGAFLIKILREENPRSLLDPRQCLRAANLPVYGAALIGALGVYSSLAPMMQPNPLTSADIAPLEAKLDRAIDQLETQFRSQAESSPGIPPPSEESIVAATSAGGAVLRSDRPQDAPAQALLRDGHIHEAVDALIQVAQADTRLAAERLREAGALALPLDVERALLAYSEAAKLEPDDFWTLIQIARLRMRMGAMAQAQAAAESAAKVAKGDWELGVAQAELGDLRLQQGFIDAALAAYLESLARTEELARAEPQALRFQRAISISHERIGEVRVLQGRLEQARNAYVASLEVRESIAAATPLDPRAQRDLWVIRNLIGDVLLQQDRVEEAETAFEAGLALAASIADGAPDKTEARRDLAISHDWIGDLRLRQGRLEDSMAAYKAGLGIAEGLARDDPRNAEAQRDLAVSYTRIGGLWQRMGRIGDAVNAFEAGLSITEGLAFADKDNAVAQRDPMESHLQLARAGTRRNLHMRTALEIALSLKNDGRLAPRDAEIIDVLQAQLGIAMMID